jgi:hypothetical protein
MTIYIPEIAVGKAFNGRGTRLVVQQGQVSYFGSGTQFFDRNVVNIDLNVSLFLKIRNVRI